MRLNIAIVTSCDSLIVKLENGLKKHIRNVAEIKYGFVKLAVIFLLLQVNSLNLLIRNEIWRRSLNILIFFCLSY